MNRRLSRKMSLTLLALCVVLFGSASPGEEPHPPDWSHEGKTYAACAAGHAQSTIDIKHVNYAPGRAAVGCDLPTLSLEAITELADQFSGSDASAKIAAAIRALPSAGGIVDAQNLSDNDGTGSTVIDPGTKSVTILLGPYIYHVSQVIVRTNLHLIGMGSGQGLAGTKQPTIIQATKATQAPFTLGQIVGEGQEGVVLRGFRITATPGNKSQSGIQFIAAQSSGLWYSELDDIYISGFAGISVDLEATNTVAPGAINQFSTFRRIVAARTNRGSYALQIKGFNNSLKFENCEFDGTDTGTAGGDGLTNIIVQDAPGVTFPPYNIKFDLLTSQWAGVAMQFNGADAVSVDQGHFEADWGVVQFGTGVSFGSLNITIRDSGFFNGTGIHGGAGFILKNLAATANVSAAIFDSHSYQTPDAFLAGNTGSFVSFGNVVGPEGSYTFLPTEPAPPIAGPFASSTSLSSNCTASGGIGTSSAVACLTASVVIPSTGGPFRILASYALFATPSGSPNGIDTWVQDDTTNCSGGNCSWAPFEYYLSASANASEIGAMMSEISPTTYAAGSGTITINLNAECNHSLSYLTAVFAAQKGPVTSHLYLEVVPSN
jgi:hypothetical protein